MSMINCRVCDAPNPAGSKFCNKCGTPMPPTTSLICPSCERGNPHHLLYCDNCGTRLVQKSLPTDEKGEEEPQSGPPQAFSLPARRPGETGDLDPQQLPEWLVTGEEEGADGGEEAPAADTPAAENRHTDDRSSLGDIPDWLGELLPGNGGEKDIEPSPDHEHQAESGAVSDDTGPPPEARTISYEELPDWLRAGMGIEGADDFNNALERALSDDEPERTRFDSEALLGWEDSFSDLAGFDEEAAVPLVEAELPAWLNQMQPPGDESGAEMTVDVDEPEQTSGPLAGLRGVIDIEPLIARPHTASRLSPLAVTADQEQQVALLRQLRHSGPRQVARLETQTAAGLSPPARLILAALLIGAVLLGLFLPEEEEIVAGELPLPAEALDVHEAIAAAAGRPVLVAVEFTPATTGEMLPLANVVLAELESNDSPILLASQTATAVGLFEMLVDGRSVEQLGFIPGEAVGLRQLAACFESAGACPPLVGRNQTAGLEEVALIIILAAERDGLINWIEQVGATTGVPMVAGVTQGLGPVVLPYIDSNQLLGVIEGLPAAIVYGDQFVASTGEPAEMLSRATTLRRGQTIAQWVVITLLVLGNVVYGLVGFRRQKQ